jgi:regulatory protein
MEKKSLMARAVDLLSRREYSRRELVQKLKPHAETEEQLEAVLDQLAGKSWQSDQRYAEQLLRAKGSRHGSLRLRHAMREKGLDAEIIEQTLAGQNDQQQAQAVWQRKFGSLPQTREDKARQMRFLAGRGFPADVIHRVLAGAPDDQDDEYAP